MSGDFAGRVVLVTGAAHGIGRVLARGFAERGAHVIVNWYRAKREAESLLAEFTTAGLSVETIRASVARQDTVLEMFLKIRERHGGLDILVNNAARGTFLPLGEFTEQDWEHTLATSFHGLRWCCREAAPMMAARGGGAIVNLSSIGARLVAGNYACMGVAKAAVETYTRYLACELAPHRIRVNAASASFVEGPVIDGFPQADQLREVTVRATPAGSLVPAEDLAAVVLFLASNASRHLTGQTVLVDGGLSTGAALLSPPAPVQSADTALTPRPAERPAPLHRKPAPMGIRPALPAVAVVGMGIAVPGASSPEQLWDLLHSTEPVFSEPGERFRIEDFWSPEADTEDKSYTRIAGFLHDFRPHPRLRRELDQGTTRWQDGAGAVWLRHCLIQATESLTTRPGDRYSCVIGQSVDGNQSLAESVAAVAALEWIREHHRQTGAPPPDPQLLLALIRTELPRALADAARLLPSGLMASATRDLVPADTELLAVDAACATSLYAMDIGAKRLLNGDCDIALCGGVYENIPRSLILLSKLQTLTPTGRVRCFHDEGDGTLFTDSSVVIALKLLARARADGDEVMAVLDGFGAASDGHGKAIYAPAVIGQTLALERARRAQQDVCSRPDWIIAHATGTAIGHTVEAQAVNAAYGSQPIPVTSNKTLIGHTGWSAGAVSVVHAVQAFRQGAIPAQLPPGTWSTPDPAQALRIPGADIPWPAAERPRRAGVSAFGFGGINAHLLLRDVPPADPADRPSGGER
ncbi:SDR family oxidoreductase [Streptomyces poriticola]|uniref:SDR family oxidoreductase n=1 Tax=Streptomyces poriticola TaxID=3120506 RepID=UPI002FCE0CB4